MDELARALGAAGRHERARRELAAPRSTASPERKIDVIPHGIPDSAGRGSRARTGSASRADRCILTFGLLSPDKGIEYVIDALPAILARFPDTVYIVLGATHPHVQGAARRDLSADARERAPSGSASTRSVIFHNRFVEPGRAGRVPRAPPTSTSRRTSSPSRSRRARWPTRSGSGKAVISTPYWLRARAARRRPRRPRAVARCRGDRARGHRSARRRRKRRDALAQRAAGHGRSMLWPAVARALPRRASRARVREHAERLRARSSRRQTLARRPAELPELNLEHLRAHDRRHRPAAARDLQRAALRRRLLPRRQRAGAAADGAASRTPAPRTGMRCARSRRATSRSCTPRSTRRRAGSATSCPTAALGRGAAGRRTATAAPSGRSAPWSAARRSGRQSLADELFHAALPATTGVHEPARVGVRAARHRRVPPRVPGRRRGRGRAQLLAERLLDALRADAVRRVALVRGPS